MEMCSRQQAAVLRQFDATPFYFILTIIEMNMIEWEDVNLIHFAENSEHQAFVDSIRPAICVKYRKCVDQLSFLRRTAVWSQCKETLSVDFGDVPDMQILVADVQGW